MPQRTAKPISRVPSQTARIQNAKPPINHQTEIPSRICNASKIQAGMLHSRFSKRLIRRQSKKPKDLFARRIYAQGSADLGVRMPTRSI